MSEKESLESLLSRVTDRRKELLTGVVNRRTRHFCMVLEDTIFRLLFVPLKCSACKMFTLLKKITPTA